MGDDKARPPFHQFVKRVLNLNLRTCIDAGCRFVQDQHRRQAKHHAGDAEQLLLSLAHRIVRHDRIEAVRHTADELPAVRLLRRGDDLLVGRIGLADGNVLTDRGILEPGLLQDHAKVAAKRMPRHFVDPFIIYRDRSAVRIIETHQQIDQRRLAASRGADDRDPHAVLGVKRKVFDQFFALIIGEIHILYIHLTVRTLHDAVGLGRLGFLLDQLKHPRGTCHRVLQLCDDRADIVEGLHVLVSVGKKCRKAADRQISCHDEPCTEQSDQCIDHIVDRTGARVGDGAEEHSHLRAFPQLLIEHVKTLRSSVFIPEGLDYLLVPDHLVDQSCLFSADLRLFLKHLECPRSDKTRHQKTHRRQHDHCQGDPNTAGKHKPDRHKNGDDSRKQLRESKQQTVRELVRIGDHSLHDIPGAVRVQVRKRQRLNIPDRP